MTASTDLLLIPVTSSAIAALAVTAGDAGAAYLLVQFHSSGKVYRYAFEDDISSGAARRWFDLLNDDDARGLTSWGSMLHRALKHGDIEPIEV